MAWLDDYLAGLRAKYPGYMVLVKQGNWYRVYDQDADVMHSILDWAVISVNGHCIASGSVSSNVKTGLKAYGYAYKIIRDGKVIETYDPPNSMCHSSAVSNLPADVVRIGSKVTVSVKGKVEKYEICRKENLRKNKISYLSPIAGALLGHKCGETVVAKVPAGIVCIKILSVDNGVAYIHSTTVSKPNQKRNQLWRLVIIRVRDMGAVGLMILGYLDFHHRGFIERKNIIN